MGKLPATSFLENKRYGLQAREQGFPKLCPTLSESQYHAISWACNEASNLGGRISATVPRILLIDVINIRNTARPTKEINQAKVNTNDDDNRVALAIGNDIPSPAGVIGAAQFQLNIHLILPTLTIDTFASPLMARKQMDMTVAQLAVLKTENGCCGTAP